MTGNNYNAHMTALAEQAAEQLQGTCKSIHDLGEEFEEAQNDKIFCERLDDLVFECEVCNWWCELSEMSDIEMTCDDCRSD